MALILQMQQVSTGLMKEVKIEVYDGVEIKVNMNGLELFTDMDDLLGKIETSLGDGSDGTVIGGYLKDISDMQNDCVRATCGHRSTPKPRGNDGQPIVDPRNHRNNTYVGERRH